jgi:hypothetical protein
MIAIFKNESHILKEWLDHYIKQGVEKICLIDNGSTDAYLSILKPYIDSNKVLLHVDATKHSQTRLQNFYFYQESKKYTWCLVCDLDEFVYARNGFNTIRDYVQSLPPSVSQVFIPWKLFGSNGYTQQPTNVVSSFTKRTNYNKESNFHGCRKEGNEVFSLTKCIARTSCTVQYDVHFHYMNAGSSISASNSPHPHGHFSKINEDILRASYLHLNHYAIQSYDWFMRVKATRGDAVGSSGENVRDESYFRGFDSASNDIDDTELASMNM